MSTGKEAISVKRVHEQLESRVLFNSDFKFRTHIATPCTLCRKLIDLSNKSFEFQMDLCFHMDYACVVWCPFQL